MPKKDYNSWSKTELIKEVKKLEKRKKYGLVWEEKKEDVINLCKEKLPVLKEDLSKEIKNNDNLPTNILIDGDNYHALSVLNYTHKGKIDIIYIDPPYNTGNKDFVYNDRFVDKEDSYRHSKWISFMYNRLSLCKSLLKRNGAIFVSIDDNEYPRLILLLEEIFGKKNLKTICVKMSEATGVKMASVIKNNRVPKLKEYLVIAKKDGINNLYLEKLPKEKWDNEYKTILTNISEEQINKLRDIRDNEKRTGDDLNYCNSLLGGLNYISLSEFFSKEKIPKKDQEDFKYKNAWRIFRSVATATNVKELADKEKKFVKGNLFCIVTPQKKMYLLLKNYNELQPQPRIKILLADDYLTQHPGDFWTDIKTTGLDNEGGVNFKNGKKPLKLIEKIIKTYFNKSITVLDFFAGSGTTGEALLRVNEIDKGTRKFILCTYNKEDGDEMIIDKYCYPRLQNVLSGYNNRQGIKFKLKYYKTDFVDADPTDKNKRNLVVKSTEMLCLKEDCFHEIKKFHNFKMFKNFKDKHLGIVYDDDGIEPLKKEIKKINKKFVVYVFSLDESAREEEFEDIIEFVDLKPIPAAILNVYKRIFRKIK